MNESFSKWWKTGIHGWDAEEELAEYRLAKDSWDACKQEVLKILDKNHQVDIDHILDKYIDGKHIKVIDMWINYEAKKEIEKL
ncbi:MAG: hypothetical protein AABY22_12330 [Nanoarchaeota archaeon]